MGWLAAIFCFSQTVSFLVQLIGCGQNVGFWTVLTRLISKPSYQSWIRIARKLTILWSHIILFWILTLTLHIYCKMLLEFKYFWNDSKVCLCERYFLPLGWFLVKAVCVRESTKTVMFDCSTLSKIYGAGMHTSNGASIHESSILSHHSYHSLLLILKAMGVHYSTSSGKTQLCLGKGAPVELLASSAPVDEWGVWGMCSSSPIGLHGVFSITPPIFMMWVSTHIVCYIRQAVSRLRIRCWDDYPPPPPTHTPSGLWWHQRHPLIF